MKKTLFLSAILGVALCSSAYSAITPVTVEVTEGTVDLSNYNGDNLLDGEHTITLTMANGTTVTNGSASVDKTHVQIAALTLTAPEGSESAPTVEFHVTENTSFGILNASYNKVSPTLNGGTINKTGAGTFIVTHTDLGNNAGTLNINEGAVDINYNSSSHNDAGLWAPNLNVNMLNGTSLTAGYISRVGTLNIADAGASVNVSATNYSLTLANASTINGTLNLTSGTLTMLQKATFGNEGTVNLSAGATLNMSGNYKGENGLIPLMAHVSGTGTVQVDAGGYTLDDNLDLNGRNLLLGGNSNLNGHGYDTSHGGPYTLTLSNGGDVTVNGTLRLESKATVNVNHADSILRVNGTLEIGHGNGGANNAYLELNAGQIIAKNIAKTNADFTTPNTFTMTGGTLTFNGAAVDSVISGIKTTISGGTLDTSSKAWVIDNSSELTDTLIGGVTVSGANSATLKNFTMTGSITASTSVTFGGAINFTGSTQNREVALTEGNGFGHTEAYATVATGSGAITSEASWTLAGETATYSNKTIAVTTGATTKYYVNDASESVDITGASDLFVKNNATLAEGSYTLSGHAEVAGGKTLSVTGNTTVTAQSYLEVYSNGTLALSGSASVASTGVVTTPGQQDNLGMWIHDGSRITIEDNAALTVQNVTFKSNTGATVITATGDAQIGGTMSEPNNVSITNAATTINSGDLREYNISGGSVTVASGVNSAIKAALSATTDLVVQSGASATFTATPQTLGSLTLESNASVTLGNEDSHNHDLTISGLTVNGNANLNANLVMNSGTMDFTSGGILTMGCDVTIGDGVQVYITGDIAAIRGGEVVTIIDGLSAEDHISLGSAQIYVNDVYQSDFFLMTVSDEGGMRVVVAPEPATATLSLLALAALAARRKRH